MRRTWYSLDVRPHGIVGGVRHAGQARSSKLEAIDPLKAPYFPDPSRNGHLQRRRQGHRQGRRRRASNFDYKEALSTWVRATAK